MQGFYRRINYIMLSQAKKLQNLKGRDKAFTTEAQRTLKRAVLSGISFHIISVISVSLW